MSFPTVASFQFERNSSSVQRHIAGQRIGRAGHSLIVAGSKRQNKRENQEECRMFHCSFPRVGQTGSWLSRCQGGQVLSERIEEILIPPALVVAFLLLTGEIGVPERDLCAKPRRAQLELHNRVPHLLWPIIGAPCVRERPAGIVVDYFSLHPSTKHLHLAANLQIDFSFFSRPFQNDV